MSYSKSKFCHFLFTLLVIAASLGCWRYGSFYKDFFLFVAGMNTMTALEYVIKKLLFDDN